MEFYVTCFLQKLRTGFPRIVIQTMSSPDEIAQARRMPYNATWAPNIENYFPKTAGGIYFNSEVSRRSILNLMARG